MEVRRVIYVQARPAPAAAAINNKPTLITSAAGVNAPHTFIILRYSPSLRLQTEKLQSHAFDFADSGGSAQETLTLKTETVKKSSVSYI